LNNTDDIEFIFEDTINSDRKSNAWDDFVGTFETLLYDEIEDKSGFKNLLSAILGIVLNWNPEKHEKIKDENEELADFAKTLATKFGLPTQRRANRINQGRKYWSNVKSDATIRSNNPVHTHELIIDHDSVFNFDSGINSTIILSKHFLQQVVEYPDIIGEDVLSYIHKPEVEEINELSEELLEKMDDYESSDKDMPDIDDNNNNTLDSNSEINE
jgi:hypothetical protein